MMLIFLYLILFVLNVGHYNCLDNGLARTPPMGWLSWERFMCTLDCVKYPHECINEQLYKDMADRLVSDGFKEVGYEYINIDDCWSEKVRDPHTHRLIPDKKRFPNGMKALADYVHSKGLKLGIYGDIGHATCAGYPSQNGPGEGYFEIDAKTFADWHIDSAKIDGCNEDPKHFGTLYPKFGKALNDTGRKMLYSCEWPLYEEEKKLPSNYTAITKTCNLYRNYKDVLDSWGSVQGIMEYYAKNQEEYVKYNGPGQWFDPDMLIIGDFGITYDQSRTQMAMWAIWSSPLYMSNDLRKLSPEYKKILQNKKVIAINQDPLGIMGKRVFKKHKPEWLEVWVKPVTPIVNKIHSYAVVYINYQPEGNTQHCSLKLSQILPHDAEKSTFTVHDLFGDDGDVIGNLHFNQTLDLKVNPAYGVRMVKLVPH